MPHRRGTSPPADDAPTEQPLWRGQLAPTEGEAAPQEEDRRRRWWGLRAPKILVGVVLLAVLAGGLMLWIRSSTPDPLAVAQLRSGDCLESPALQAGRASVSDLRRVSCDGPHDAEMFATFDAGQSVTDLEAAGRRCSNLLSPATGDLQSVTERGLEVRPLAAAGDIDNETRVACFVRHRSGDKMTTTILDSNEPDTEDDR